MTVNRLDELKRFLRANGWLWKSGKPIPYGEQILILAGSDQVTLDFYPKRGRMVVGGPDSPLKTAVQAWVGAAPAATPAAPAIPPPHIGLDEAGKGDWFGPLAVAAVAVDMQSAGRLHQAGVRDSKELHAEAIPRLAQQVERIVPPAQRHVVILPPEQYNQVYAHYANINLLLADAYAQAAAEVRPALVAPIVCDQFSQRADRLEHAFERRGLPRPHQQHHAEAVSIAVAAASILASAAFSTALAELGQAAGLGTALPRGASDIAALEQAARWIIAREGADGLGRYAKLNFKPVQALLKAEGGA